MIVCEISWNIIHHRSDASSWHENKGEKMLEGEVTKQGPGVGLQRGFGSQKLKSQGGEGADLRFDEMLGNSPLFDIVRGHRHPVAFPFLCSFWWAYKRLLMWIFHTAFSKLKSYWNIFLQNMCTVCITSVLCLFCSRLSFSVIGVQVLLFPTTRSIWGKRKTAIDRFVFFFAHQYLW